MPLTLQIITPERVVFQEEGVDSVTLPGVEGELGEEAFYRIGAIEGATEKAAALRSQG